MKKVENINFTLSPLKAEQKRQSKIVADKICRHTRKLERVTLIDADNDRVEEYIMCPQCKREMREEDIIERDNYLKKFK